MSTIAMMQMGLMGALGVSTLEANDASVFAPECGKDFIWNIREGFSTRMLKTMTKGVSMYQSWYGDAFSYKEEGCGEYAAELHSAATKAGVDAVANEILGLTKQVTYKNTTSCDAALAKL